MIDTAGKVCTVPLLLEWLAPLKEAGRKVVFTNGVFDLLHPGHIRALADARKMGDCLVVGVNSDSSVRALKGDKRPIFPDYERAKILASLESVDFVTIFAETTPAELICAVSPDILVKGGDYKPEEIVGADVVTAAGGEVKTVNFAAGWSTSAIVERICSLHSRD